MRCEIWSRWRWWHTIMILQIQSLYSTVMILFCSFLGEKADKDSSQFKHKKGSHQLCCFFSWNNQQAASSSIIYFRLSVCHAARPAHQNKASPPWPHLAFSVRWNTFYCSRFSHPLHARTVLYFFLKISLPLLITMHHTCSFFFSRTANLGSETIQCPITRDPGFSGSSCWVMTGKICKYTRTKLDHSGFWFWPSELRRVLWGPSMACNCIWSIAFSLHFHLRRTLEPCKKAWNCLLLHGSLLFNCESETPLPGSHWHASYFLTTAYVGLNCGSPCGMCWMGMIRRIRLQIHVICDISSQFSRY